MTAVHTAICPGVKGSDGGMCRDNIVPCNEEGESGKEVLWKEGPFRKRVQVCSFKDEFSGRYDGRLFLVDTDAQTGEEVS